MFCFFSYLAILAHELAFAALFNVNVWLPKEGERHIYYY
jgi:hypothetical protein